MSDVEIGAIEDETDGAAPTREPKSSKAWLKLISDAERIMRTYQDKADSIDRLYANLERLSKDSRDREFQLFWANVQVLGPSVYSRPPIPVVVPRFKDRKALSRTAAELLERCAIVGIATESIDEVMRLVRDDLVIQARGAVWIRYEAKKGKDGKLLQKVCIDHADRKDFLTDPARKWKEVDWVAKRSWMTKPAMRKRFRKTSGDAYLKAVYAVVKDDPEAEDSGKLKAGVWELWSKSADKVVWVAEGCEVVLDEDKPHLDLEGFFPCPKPAYATVQRRTLIPVPDFVFYKDQLEEINELTARIASLCDSLRVRGFYPAGAGDIGDAIEAAVKNSDDRQVLIGISNWQAFGNGAAKDTIVWLPLEQIATTITQCVTLRKQLFDDVYQITGLSDIMRGQTEASETLGAQQLKSEYGSVRIRDRKDEMVRLACDITRIMAEIMAENFKPQTLLDMSQLEIPTDAMMAGQAARIEQQIRGILQQVEKAKTDPQLQQQAAQNPQRAQQVLAQAKQQVDGLKGQLDQLKQVPTIEKVMALLREQRIRPFVLDIETDSTIAPDENAQKQRATEFMTAFGGVLEKVLPAIQTAPEGAPMFAEMIKFTASQFRVGRPMEGVIDEFADKMVALASQPKQPSAEQQKAAAEAKAAEAKAAQDAEETKVLNAERMARVQREMAEAQATVLREQTKAADAETARKISEQQEFDASEARRVEREGKMLLTNKQIELLDAKRADEIVVNQQMLAKGSLEIDLLNAKITQANKPAPAPKAAQPSAGAM